MSNISLCKYLERTGMSKVILITGASTGIGAETAMFLANNNQIIVHYNSSGEEAKQVADEVTHLGGKAHLVQANLSAEEGCQKLAEYTSRNFDRLDLLINNAGSLIKRHTATELEWDLMQQTFAVNVFSAMKLSSLCIPLLENGNYPCIVNITSIAMRHGAPTATIYGAAKAALDSFTRGLAKELAPAIRVNAVAPGVIETPFHEKFSSRERMEAFKEATPLKINGKAKHVAMAIEMLIENQFITGETIDVNGGLFMR